MSRDFFDDNINKASDDEENSNLEGQKFQENPFNNSPFNNPYQNNYWAYPKKTKKKKGLIAVAFVVIMLVGVAMLLTSIYGKGWTGDIFDGDRISITIPIVDKPVLDSEYYDATTKKYTAQGIGKTVMPSVVSILVYEKGTMMYASSQGSGIVLTENGYIITNAHVVDGATRGIKVVLNDETEYKAEIVGSDSKTDLAVIKIKVEGLTPATFGNSDQLEIGEEIIALGSPGGLYSSLTKGVVSGLNRMISTEAGNVEMNCVQIDAAINPGNSGGALVNMFGQVVGINSSKFASELFDGIGFAISINEAIPIIEELIESGYIKDRIRIGIQFYEISESAAQIHETKAGLYISLIDESCDIANSGLEVDDTITHLDGVRVYSVIDVNKALEGKKPGDTVTATVYRQDITGDESTFEITFKLMEDTSNYIQSDQ